jgi:parallel beta-helix repeat protein
MAISVNECADIVIANNHFKQIKSSGLSFAMTTGSVTGNHVENVQGNGFFISDSSDLTVSGNVITDTNYPAFAILQGSTVRAVGNEISGIEKSGICIREAQSAVLESNKISNCRECGVSVSDTANCVLTKNVISACAVAAFEAYNESHAEVRENEFIGVGKFGFVVYTGGVIVANRNKLTNASEAFVHFSAFGGGDFTDNVIMECPSLMSGHTNASLFLARNGGFESLTNTPDRVTDGVILKEFPPDPKSGKCLRCGVRARQGFCHPCGHRAFCNQCGNECKALPDALCPLCRFPVTDFTNAFELGEDNTCLICTNRLVDAIVLPCGHTGCWACLHEWLQSRDTCPVCRREHAHCRRVLPDY